MVEPAGFARALDADSVARTAHHRPSCNRKRQHVLVIESAKAEARVRRIEKILKCCGTRSRLGAVRPAPSLE